MKRTIILVIGVSLLALLAGFLVGTNYGESHIAKQVPRSRVIMNENSDVITFYTYYVNAEGKEVLHGWEYIVINKSITKKRFENGKLIGVSGFSLRD